MRVLQVMECTIGGTRRHLRDVVLGLLRRGVEVEVACAAIREPRMREDMAAMRTAGAQVHEIPMLRRMAPLRDARQTVRLAALIFDRRFDVIHTHSSKAGALGRLAGLLVSGAARVHTPHTFAASFDGGAGQGGQNAGPAGLIMATERLLGRCTDRMLHVSEGERDEGQALGVIAPGRAEVVPNGIDPEPFEAPSGGAALRAELGIPDDAPLIGSVGLLNDAKGYDLLIDALAGMAADVHLVILGHGEREAQLRQRADEAGLGSRLHLAGWRDEVHAAHAAMDVFVLSSRWEGMSYSLMEAMAAGLPCVSTAVNGAETLLGGQHPCGRVVPREDPAALAAACGELLHDRAAAEHCGGQAAARIRQEFTLEHMLDRLQTVYADVARAR